MPRVPSTNATRLLRARGVAYGEHLYRYQEHGGTRVSARELGVDEHAVVKTLVFEDDRKQPFLILMHGDREVSTRELARQLGVRHVQPCRPEDARRHSGYLVGGTSPFGTRKPMTVYVEASVLDLPRLYVNGGARGFLVGLDPKDLAAVLDPKLVRVATPG